ncbi:hypothetical protein F5984_13125 [Rudanella paleaurantiibacter]|uniref:Uncharacterized protein n=1 Tax=Rudanella paleaurantiibacter TaxID=2614655 RepID=A0A7J5TY90_9BACT|nr:hypothetical protein [Rudanella paleaurantiibacter]KAB7730119.1 hypothetical protein F5984_13125 [Rudanella paleaurantiibacter]
MTAIASAESHIGFNKATMKTSKESQDQESPTNPVPELKTMFDLSLGLVGGDGGSSAFLVVQALLDYQETLIENLMDAQADPDWSSYALETRDQLCETKSLLYTIIEAMDDANRHNMRVARQLRDPHHFELSEQKLEEFKKDRAAKHRLKYHNF